MRFAPRRSASSLGEPVPTEGCPTADRWVVLREAEAVATVGINMERERDAIAAECACEEQAVLDRDAVIVGGVPKKRWRSVWRHLRLVREQGAEIVGWIFANQPDHRIMVPVCAERNDRIAEN